MFEFLKKKKQRFTSIRVQKTYDGIQFKDEYITGTEAQTKQNLNEIVKHPKRFAYQYRQKDTLSDTPNISVELLKTPKTINGKAVVCEIKLAHTTILPKPRMNPVVKILLFLTIWSVLGGVFLFATLQREGEQVEIDSKCYYYTKNGTPSSIIVRGTEYKLDANGKLNPVDEAFFNPWHRQDLNDCMYIETGGTK